MNEVLGVSVDSQFCIFRNQPVILVLAKLSHSNWLVAFAVTATAFILPKVVLTGVSGTLTSSAVPFDDFGRLIRRVAQPGPEEISFLRDYADIAIAILMAAHTAHLVGQWERVSRLPLQLQQDSLIADRALSERQFSAILVSFDARFNTLALEVLAIAAALPVGFIVVGTAQSRGIYRWLATSSGTPALDHATGWWANADLYPAAFALQGLMYSIYFYLLFRHTMMGVVAVWLVLAVRHNAGGSHPWLDIGAALVPDPLGVRELRQAINDVAISIILMAVTLLVGNFYMVFPLWLDVSLILPYLILNPLFLLIPAWELNAQIGESQRRFEEERGRMHRSLLAEAAAASGTEAQAWFTRAEIARAEYERARGLPRRVIDWADVGRRLVIYAVPVIALLLAILDRV